MEEHFKSCHCCNILLGCRFPVQGMGVVIWYVAKGWQAMAGTARSYLHAGATKCDRLINE